MKTRRFFTLVVAVVAIAFATPALTQDQEERWQGLAQHLGTGPSGQVPIQIVVTRWSSIEETQKLVDVLVKDGHEKFADALGDTEETGFIRFPGGRTQFPSTRLHLARQFQDGDKRTIMLATSRPVGFLEAARGEPPHARPRPHDSPARVRRGGRGQRYFRHRRRYQHRS